jgi:hypothetical protein
VACNRLLVHEETREMLAVTTAAPGAVAVLMGHPHPGIAAEACDAAYLISDYDRCYGDGRLAEELKTRRYMVHNARWCAVMAKASQGARAHPKGDTPGAAGAALVKSILRDEKKLFTCCVALDGEYGQSDICLGVPVTIGKNGWEQILPLELSASEQEAFEKSAAAVRSMNEVLG